MKHLSWIAPGLFLACTSLPPAPRTANAGTESGEAASAGSQNAGTANDGTAEASAPMASPQGWLSWRGPAQEGRSLETDLPDTVTLDGEGHLWTYEIPGRGTPVVADGRVFTLAYDGEGAELQEVVLCLDEATGERLWEHRFSDFVSDIVYDRYAIGSPTVDPETGNVFAMTSAGLFNAFTPEGEPLWQVSLGEEFGRLTFPNGRTGAPVVVGDLVIVHFIFSSWGPLGPARDRFFAFDRETGECVWGSTPGTLPKDSSFCMPYVEERGGRTVLYATLGGGNVACVNALNGDPIWRFPLAIGGLNSSPVVHGDKLIAVNGKENIDTSTIGRMVALRLDHEPDEDGVLGPEAEVWRNDLTAFTSSPVLVGDRVYLTTYVGDLACVDVETGEVLWKEKLAADQLHASPVAADGKLYVPMNEGHFYVIRPSDEGAEILSKVELEGNCLGAPAVANGRIYVHTTKKLYCFGRPDGAPAPEWPVAEAAEPGPPARLQLVPADVTFRVGEEVPFRVRRIDAAGRVIDEVERSRVELEHPPHLGTTEAGDWTASRRGSGVVTASFDGLTGTARLRAVPSLPFHEDFEGIDLDKGGDEPFAFPPSYWLSAGPKWRVVAHEGGKVVRRQMDNPLFQRTNSLFGHPDDSNYTVQVDFKPDGNRRTISTGGVIHQRYLVLLKGNYQELEVSSNEWRLKQSVPFKIRPNVWYTLKTRVDVADDGSGVVRAKAWPREEPEPEAWTIEVEHAIAHRHGAAGLHGFTPQSRFTVYMDNLSVTPNE